jgi:hypothetical protein
MFEERREKARRKRKPPIRLSRFDQMQHRFDLHHFVDMKMIPELDECEKRLTRTFQGHK